MPPRVWTEALGPDGNLCVQLNGVPHCSIKPSPIHGRGFYAARAFRKGDYLGTFTGQAVAASDAASHNQGYLMALTRPGGKGAGLIDTSSGSAPYCQFMNSSWHTPLRNNARFNSRGTVVATRTIKPGEEALVSYGSHYWRGHAGALAADQSQ